MANQQRSTEGNQPVPQMPERVNIERVTKYDVYDAADNHIGSTGAIWMDKNSEPAFIGIKTGWLIGKTHVIPAWGAQVNHAAKRVRIPCDADIVRDAPAFSPEEEFDEAKERQVLEYYQTKGACQPTHQPERGTAGTETGRPAAEETTLPLHEETVKVGKRTVEAGGVRLRKIIRTETVQQPVEIQHEEIKIERVPATGQQASEHAFEDQDLYIPLRREEPVVEKQTRVREEVRARKTTGTERGTVSEQVRKEDVQVEGDEEHRRAA